MKELKTEGLDDFLKVKDFLIGKIEHYRSELAVNEERIENIVNEPLKQIRLLQGKDTGIIAAIIEGVEVKQDVPKKVVWDQKKMESIIIKIKNAGDDPDKYVTAKYSISEKQFKGFPPAIQTVFIQAREIKIGKARLTFKIKEVRHDS